MYIHNVQDWPKKKMVVAASFLLHLYCVSINRTKFEVRDLTI